MPEPANATNSLKSAVPSPAIEAGTSASCQLLAERGISIDHSTTHRWVVHFSPLLLKRFGSTD